MKRTSVLLMTGVLIASLVVGTGLATGKDQNKSKWQALDDRVLALELQNQVQRQQIADLLTRVGALEGGGGGGGGGGRVPPPDPPEPGLVVDQSELDVTFAFSPRDQNFIPLGQQFAPTKNSLAAVSVRIELQTFLTGDVVPPDAVIVVRKGTDLTGSVIATAPIPIEPPAFPLDQIDWLSAVFDPAVSLTPGEPYTIELQVTGGSTNVSMWWQSTSDDPYPGGCAIVSGVENCISDMAFVTWAAG
jgi:hypothetical protein